MQNYKYGISPERFVQYPALLKFFKVLTTSRDANSKLGMASALDTMCGQAYGAQQYHMLGIHMQRAMFILLLVSIPLAVIWNYTGPILAYLGQNLEIATEAGLYARWMIPRIFAYELLQCHVRFLQTQSIVFPMMIITGITALCHVCVMFLFAGF